MYGTQHPLTTNNSFARTSVQRARTATTLFPLSTTLSLEQCTSSCHTFPLRRAVGFRALPMSLFSPCDAPVISRYPHPEGEPCNICTLLYEPVAPMAYQLILEPGIGQIREFESP